MKDFDMGKGRIVGMRCTLVIEEYIRNFQQQVKHLEYKDNNMSAIL